MDRAKTHRVGERLTAPFPLAHFFSPLHRLRCMVKFSNPEVTLLSHLAPLYLWFLLVGSRPHKEERFLYPVYHLVPLTGGVTVWMAREIGGELRGDERNTQQCEKATERLLTTLSHLLAPCSPSLSSPRDASRKALPPNPHELPYLVNPRPPRFLPRYLPELRDVPQLQRPH